MLKRHFLLSLALMFGTPAQADTVVQTVLASCMRLAGQFSLRFDDVWNPSDLESSAADRIDGKPIACVIEGVKLVATYKSSQPQDHGACGAMQGGNLTLTVDGANYFKDALVNWCHTSIMSIDVFFHRGEKNGEVKVCTRAAEGVAWECQYKPFSVPLKQQQSK